MILEGVKPGERVIIRGMQRVQDGVPVEAGAGTIEPTPDPALAPAPDLTPTIGPG